MKKENNKNVMLNLFQHPHRLFATRGFTLIELLVVVLIIGILAAVSVPQYKKAVEKSRIAQPLTLLKSVAQAGQAYYLANGTYPTSFSQLEVNIPWTETEPWNKYALDTRSNGEWSIQIVNSSAETKAKGFLMGRLTGPYKGSGFMYYYEHYKASLNQILCGERYKNGGVTYSGNTASYCGKVLKYKWDSDDGNLKIFKSAS